VTTHIAVVIFLVVLAAIWDWRSRRIPNWLTLPALAVGLLFHTISHGVQGLTASLGGAGCALFIFGLVYLLGGMGAGDVKLMTAAGALLALPAALAALISAVTAGGLIALCAMAWHWARSLRDPSRQTLALREIRLPYGIAIAAGTLWTVARGISP